MGLDNWTGWLEEHGPTLVLVARQYVPSRTDAEDIVQEAFLRFWRARDQAVDPVAYLYACVRGCALEWLRGNRRRAHRESAVARHEASADSALFFAPLAQAERRSAIEEALQQLPEAQREVLVLKIWAGLSFTQVAQALGIPINTAGSRYRYALAKMRELLAEESIR
jgi:RNA polymerase sigma-70 factor (ECF subfamily)